jgi:phospholipid/cholesterol/gamma-HCH transport system substrate-binding protein
MTIDRNIPIPEDSIAKISSDGVLGGAYVAIEPGASEDMLREGDKITITRGSVDLLNLAVQAFTSQTSNNKSGNSDNSEPDPLGDM